MARLLSTLLTAALALTAQSAVLSARQSDNGVTCNIDLNTFQTKDPANACNAIPAHSKPHPTLSNPPNHLLLHPFIPNLHPLTVTITGTTTLLARSPTNADVTVFLNQQELHWSGSGARATQLCNQLVAACGGTVGVAEMNGASISTEGDFGGPGTISVIV